jgi:penicillin-binding protein 1A
VTRALALGSSEVTVLDQATGYSAFANGGYRIRPRGIIDVRTPSGEIAYDAATDSAPRQRVLSEHTVLGMIDMLHNVVMNGTGRRAQLPGINVAGKTGTTNAYRDAWFCGFTGNFTTAVWLGNDNYESTERLTGGILPAETWQKYMRVAMASEEIEPLPGLPPPEIPDEEVVAEADGAQSAIAPGAFARLVPETAATLDRLGLRFRSASAAAPLRQASLGQAPISAR